MPQIDGIASTYADRGVVVMGINYKESLGIVQNYQNMYPNILMLRDTSGSVYNQYRQNGYIPLNYVIDHDLSQTVLFWMEGYSHSTIQNKIINALSDVSVNLTPFSTQIPLGTQLQFDITVENHITGAGRFCYMLLQAETPSGGSVQVGNVTTLNLAPAEVRVINKNLTIPVTAPLGTYRMKALLGMPPSSLWTMDFFDFDIVP